MQTKQKHARTDLPADTRGQVLHNQAVLGAHWGRVPTENNREPINQLNTIILGGSYTKTSAHSLRAFMDYLVNNKVNSCHVGF